MRKFKYIFITTLLLFIVALSSFAQTKDLLSPEETLWLQSRNNTIVVYPEENNPPYSYKNSAGNPQGLAIEYLDLIAEKIGAKIQYLTPRSRSQVMTDFQAGKGDVVASVTPDTNKEQFMVFTGNYLTSPAVIVVRKDYNSNAGLNLNDFNGKRVAVINSSALESYMRINYPRVVIEEVTDDEIGLQQVVLGEADAAAMDVASLSYFLSKQVLNSVKVIGNTGFEYKPSFGISKTIPILQSIIEKGLSQISTSDRSLLNDKWIVVPAQNSQQDTSLLAQIRDNVSIITLYVLFGLGVIVIVVLLIKRRNPMAYFTKPREISELEHEVFGLEKSNTVIAEELKIIKEQEDRLEKKIDSIGKPISENPYIKPIIENLSAKPISENLLSKPTIENSQVKPISENITNNEKKLN